MNKAFRLWITTAFTVFMNGCMEGLNSGLVVGGANGAKTAYDGATDVKSVGWGAIEGFLAGLLGHGVTEFSLWRRQYPMPNPFLTTKGLSDATLTASPFPVRAAGTVTGSPGTSAPAPANTNA